MPSLSDMHLDELEVALNATGTLMTHRAFLPRGGMLLMLLSRFRDDTREAIGMEPERFPGRGVPLRSLDELTSAELSTVAGAVATLLEPRFVSVMDDPELVKELRDFNGELGKQQAERREIQASIAS